jgi:hypothetical protein
MVRLVKRNEEVKDLHLDLLNMWVLVAVASDPFVLKFFYTRGL